MRKLLIPWLAICLLVGLNQRAQAADEPKDIIEKAIKAYGGEEKLSKLMAGRAKTKGKIELLGGITFSGESSFQLPGKFKEVQTLEVMGKQATITVVYNGKEAWAVDAQGKTQELGGKELEEVQEQAYLGRISRLLPLREKEFQLAPLGEVKVEGKAAVGVKVSSKGHRDVNYYFDKSTGLLAKVERRVADQGGKEVTEERLPSDYHAVNGIQSPKKLVVRRDGKKFMEVEIEEVKILDKIDDSEFVKP